METFIQQMLAMTSVAGKSGRCDLVASATYRPIMLLRFCLAPARPTAPVST